MIRTDDKAQAPAYRADIDGLRAVSILLVVFFHAFPGLLPGGYLGVDVFFVISGYLITALVSRERQRGEFGFGRFYARRVRRLFPALFLVTLACLAFGWFALLPEEYAQLGRHALAGSLFVPNLALWSEAGYWDTASALKPLLHLWSLGVEEQFYLVWPALLLVFGRRLALPLWAAPLALLSFAASLVAASSSPEAAFYLPWFRMGELMLGGILAHFTGATGARNAVAIAAAPATAMSLAGLVAIVAPAFAFGGDANHSPWSVLLPDLGSALVIAAGASSLANRALLANPAMVLLGRVSYPLYLWHWPLLSFVAIVEGPGAPASAKLGLLAAALLLALATWRLAEMPVRRAKGNGVVFALLVLYLGAGAAGGLVWVRGGFPARTAAIAAQLDAFEWESKGLYERDDCSKELGVPTRCLSNGKPASVAVVGDSYSTNVFFTLQELHKDDDTGVIRLGKAGCLPLYDLERFLGPASQNCRAVMNASLDYVAKDAKIRTVVLTLRPSLYLGTAGGNRLVADANAAARPAPDVFREALDRTVARLADAGKDVVFALDWPELDFDPKTCVDIRPLRWTGYRQRNCAIDRAKADALFPFYRALVLEVLAGHPRTKAWDPKKVLCDDRACAAMLDGVMLYRDDHHLSLAGSEYLGRHFQLDEPPRG